MDSDEEDYVFFGTPIEREEEITDSRKKAAAEASGYLRSLPSWKQDVRDEEGRRRFHGAFTGGFSAGYFNTVGTKECWAPQSFTSWWKNRAEVKQQSIFNFLDEDEKDFDTFGFTAAKYASNKLVRNKSKGLSNACIHFFLSAAPDIDGLPENISGKVIVEKFAQDDKKVKSPSRHPRNRNSSSSSEDERSRKHSRRHRYRSSDSWSDNRDRHRSRSKGRRKNFSLEKSSSSRKHSKRHKHRNRNSPRRSNQGSKREHSEARKEKQKQRA